MRRMYQTTSWSLALVGTGHTVIVGDSCRSTNTCTGRPGACLLGIAAKLERAPGGEAPRRWSCPRSCAERGRGYRSRPPAARTPATPATIGIALGDGPEVVAAVGPFRREQVQATPRGAQIVARSHLEGRARTLPRRSPDLEVERRGSGSGPFSPSAALRALACASALTAADEPAFGRTSSCGSFFSPAAYCCGA